MGCAGPSIVTRGIVIYHVLDKVTAEDKDKIESSIEKLREAVVADDFETMKMLNKTLQDELMEIGKKVYAASDNNKTEDSNKAKQNDNDSVIDADFSETK